MAFRLSITRSPRMAAAQVTALASHDEAQEIVMAIAEQTREHGDKRLLIDLTDFVGTLDIDSHRWAGELVFRHLSHLERIASLVPEDKITRVSEQTAQAHGVQLRVFAELTSAVEWLIAP
jgi:predicted nucleic acid-binding Zn ribbon protein